MLAFFLGLALTAFEAICEMLFFDTFLSRKPKKGNWISSLAIIAIITVSATATNLLVEWFWIKWILVCVTLCIISRLFYKTTLVLALILSAAVYFLLAAIEFLSISLFLQISAETYQSLLSDQLSFTILGMLAKLSLFIAIILVRYRWRASGRGYGKNSGSLLILYPPIIGIVSIAAFVFTIQEVASPSQRTFMVIAAVGLLFLSPVIFYLTESLRDMAEKTRENDLLRQKVEIETESVLSMARTFDNQRMMMHDYDNHLQAIQRLLDSGKCEKAAEYVSQMSKSHEKAIHRIKTNHDIVDAVLNQKDLLAKSKGIILELHAGDMAEVPMRSDDLVTLLANVLDNAIEACEKVDTEKIIRVKLEYTPKQLLFSVINPVASPVLIVDNRIETSKEDKYLHGLGLRNISLVLEKYGSSYELFCEDGFFQFTCILCF